MGYHKSHGSSAQRARRQNDASASAHLHQPSSQYGDALGEWQPVPNSVSTIEQFVIVMQADDRAEGG
jgi:hypothetical protein